MESEEAKRSNMLFYRGFYEAIEHLNFEEKGMVYSAIFNYGLNFVEPELPNHLKTIFMLLRPQLDANIKKFKNGVTIKMKDEEKKRIKKIAKDDAQKLANINDQNLKGTVSKLSHYDVDDNRNLKEINLLKRKELFIADVKLHEDLFVQKVIDGFIDYWSEPNLARSKMKWELQKTWDTKRRLRLWNDRHWDYENKKNKIINGTRNDTQLTAVDEFRKKLLQQVGGKVK
jgi:hypothetical protein